MIALKVNIVRAKLSDERFIYWLRNESTVRSASKNTAEIAWPDHVKWFRKATKRLTFFVIRVNWRRVGYIRIDPDGDVSFALLPTFRGQGIIPSLLKRLSAEGYKMRALVRIDNASSVRACSRGGMRLKYFVFEND